MRVVSIEQSQGTSGGQVDPVRQEESAESFESSLMGVLDAGAESEVEEESRPDQDMEAAEAQAEQDLVEEVPAEDPSLLVDRRVPGERVQQVVDAGEEQSAARPQGLAKVPASPAGNEGVEQPPPVSQQNMREDSPQPASAPLDPAAAAQHVPRGADTSQAREAAVERTEGEPGRESQRIHGEHQQDAAQVQELREATAHSAERPQAHETLPRQEREETSAPRSTTGDPRELRAAVTDSLKTASDPRSGDGGEREGTSGRDRSQGQNETPQEPSVRVAATEEIPVESQSVRNLAAVSQSVEGLVNPVQPDGTMPLASLPVEPVVEPAEPAAPVSSARPMPPEAIPQHIEWLVARGGGSAHIELHPPELGRLAIQVTVRNGDVQVVMNVQESAAQTVVAEYRDTLENGLSSKDLKLDQFEVRDWNHRDGSQPRENDAERGHEGSEGRGGTRDREERTLPQGVAGTLMHPGRGSDLTAGDTGINLRV